MKKSFVKTVATLIVGMMIGSATVVAAAPNTVQAVLSKFKIIVDGEQQTLKSDPLVYKGTTYLPVREIASMLDAEVSSVDNKSKKIELKTNKSQTPTTQNNVQPEPPKPLKLKLNETATRNDMTLTVKGVNYTDFIPYASEATSGMIAEKGNKFALIQFEATLKADPKDRSSWGALDFFDHAMIGGKKISAASSYDHINLLNGETKTVQILITLPENTSITSITFRNPSDNSIFGSITL